MKTYDYPDSAAGREQLFDRAVQAVLSFEASVKSYRRIDTMVFAFESGELQKRSAKAGADYAAGAVDAFIEAYAIATGNSFSGAQNEVKAAAKHRSEEETV
jgi:hypothetical protein